MFNCKNNIRIILNVIWGKKETKLLQGTAVINLHSIFLSVNGYIFVRGHCRQLKLGTRVNKFSVNLISMCKNKYEKIMRLQIISIVYSDC